MGCLCAKDDTRKKRTTTTVEKGPNEKRAAEQTDYEGPAGDVGGSGAPSDSSLTDAPHNASDEDDAYPEEVLHGLRAQRQGTEPFGTSPRDRFDNDDGQAAVSPATLGDGANSVATRTDLFPADQDATLNMRVGADKYKDLTVASSTDEDGHYHRQDDLDSRTELHSFGSATELTPERHRSTGAAGAAGGVYSYDPRNFIDEDTSVVERRSDAFQTPRDALTDSVATTMDLRLMLPSLSVAASTSPAASTARQQPQQQPLPPQGALSTMLPRPSLASPHHQQTQQSQPIQRSPQTASPPTAGNGFARTGSAVSAASFTVTTARNNNSIQITPKSPQPSGARGVALSEVSEPYASPKRFYSCRSDMASVGGGEGWANGWPTPSAMDPSDAAFMSCRSLDSVSSQGLAAMRVPSPATRLTAKPSTSASAEAGGAPVAAQRVAKTTTRTASSTKRTVPPTTATAVRRVPAQRPLARDAQVLRTVPTSLPLPKAAPGAESVALPGESHVTMMQPAAPVRKPPPSSASAKAARSTAASPAGATVGRKVAPASAAVRSPSVLSVAPPPSSAFRSFPASPSTLEGGYAMSRGRVESMDEDDFQSAISPTSASVMTASSTSPRLPLGGGGGQLSRLAGTRSPVLYPSPPNSPQHQNQLLPQPQSLQQQQLSMDTPYADTQSAASEPRASTPLPRSPKDSRPSYALSSNCGDFHENEAVDVQEAASTNDSATAASMIGPDAAEEADEPVRFSHMQSGSEPHTPPVKTAPGRATMVYSELNTAAAPAIAAGSSTTSAAASAAPPATAPPAAQRVSHQESERPLTASNTNIQRQPAQRGTRKAPNTTKAKTSATRATRAMGAGTPAGTVPRPTTHSITATGSSSYCPQPSAPMGGNGAMQSPAAAPASHTVRGVRPTTATRPLISARPNGGPSTPSSASTNAGSSRVSSSAVAVAPTFSGARKAKLPQRRSSTSGPCPPGLTTALEPLTPQQTQTQARAKSQAETPTGARSPRPTQPGAIADAAPPTESSPSSAPAAEQRFFEMIGAVDRATSKTGPLCEGSANSLPTSDAHTSDDSGDEL